MIHSDFEVCPVSALEKVRSRVRPQLFENENTALEGERVCFQVAYRSIGWARSGITFSLEGVPEGYAEVYPVTEVPCGNPCVEGSDDYLLTETPCMMPDLLAPVSPSGVTAKYRAWQAFYVILTGLPAGDYKMRFRIREGGEVLGEADYLLHVLAEKLPEADLVCTYWMHYDCIANYYHLPVFSEEYNRILESFLRSAVGHGLTMLLTPLFTPPLDTQVGGERLTVQLIDVEKRKGGYSFGFARLGWFMRFARSCGVKYFEMSHLFSQWGAKFAPKIVAKENGAERRIFGWDTEALSEEYKAFLAAFLPQLRGWLIENGFYERCYFHISDEPSAEAFAHYKACHDFVKGLLPDGKFVDAMSHYDYFTQKLVDLPFVALDATEPFLAQNEPYFVYYCTAQHSRFVSNRFLSMPLERTRVLGIQMYRNGVRGFLHWGYNFYNSVLSREAIDPFAVTDGMGGLQSGDPFTVYPGKDGALSSLRNEAFYMGLQDYRALTLLEEKIGRERVIALLDENGVAANFTDYPKNALWLLSLRNKINKEIAEH